ncbi:AI-2E family transporter [Caryophanon tenue]|uniref:AI-2E family transporter n=1 Tax=Caryophanon tenue TaxID=33978 RepID=A0A1C0Y6W4_9BACL|nr:AI-2E family transporter [Caryophanon tenue]OCS82927.1 AI-2E family transporter [Caryophanon tenue]
MNLHNQDEKPPRKREKESFFDTKFIRFLGGKNMIFITILLLLIGSTIFVFDKISFVFHPLAVLFEVVVLPGVLGVILYYLLRPILRILMKWRIPKGWGILLIFIGAIGALTLLIVLVFPFLRDQFTELVQEFPNYVSSVINNTVQWINNSRFDDFFARFNIDYMQIAQDLSNDLITTVKDTLSTFAQSIASGLTSFVSALTGFVLSLVIVPFILFYLLWEGEKLPKFVLRIFPPRAREEVHAIMSDMDKQISSYIQGQILVSICIGIMITIGFLIIGMPYALLLGFLAMITSVVPYLGPVIAITPAVILAIVSSPFMLIKLAVVWTIVQLVEGKFISPQIMGKSLSIHPITIIFVLLTAGSLFGVPGVILGIPGYALLKVLVTHIFKAFKRRYNRFEDMDHYKYD